MSGNQYPSDVQFAGLIQAATAAADAQERNISVLGKRQRSDDDGFIDVRLRDQPAETVQGAGQLPSNAPVLQSSASVLFREPSEKSKKYSRPPLGKVYLDLQIAPETFLRLQNAAKLYMLDEEHMERRDVVGHKKNSSNNDVAKLRLWGCVESFLHHDNNGETFFGHNAGFGIPDTPVRTIFWPEDSQTIIKLCMPLFRKMVTNERQRIYASETRKQDSTKMEKTPNSAAVAVSHDAEGASPQPLSTNKVPSIDLTLDLPDVAQAVSLSNSQQQQSVNDADTLMLHVNIIKNDNGSIRRIAPRFSVSSDIVGTLSTLIAEARKNYEVGNPVIPASEQEWFWPTVKVWLPDGTVRIKNDGQWMVALLSASMVDWMDSELRVLIEVETNPQVISI